MRDTINPDLFVVAEYWHPDIDALKSYLDLVDKQLMLFDVALHHRFHDASKQGGDFDMRTIFDGSLLSAVPDHAVTLVDNHDTQPLQLEAPVEPRFKPLAYAIILLREEGVPCVFYPDLSVRPIQTPAMTATTMRSSCRLSNAFRSLSRHAAAFPTVPRRIFSTIRAALRLFATVPPMSRAALW